MSRGFIQSPSCIVIDFKCIYNSTWALFFSQVLRELFQLFALRNMCGIWEINIIRLLKEIRQHIAWKSMLCALHCKLSQLKATEYTVCLYTYFKFSDIEVPIVV